MMARSAIFLCIIAFGFIFHSCDDSTQEDLQNNLQAAGDLLVGELYYWDAFTIADKVARDSTLWQTGTATIDKAVCQVMEGDIGITIDYGETGITCPDGKVRSGVIIMDLPLPYIGDTLNAGIQFQDYIVDGYRLDGNIGLEGSGLPEKGSPIIGLEVKNGRITVDEREIIWKTTQIVRWAAGLDTPYDISDDELFLLKGSQFEGTASNLIGFSATVTDSLKWTRQCDWISSGMADLSMPALEVSTGSLDFGQGNCDDRVDLLFAGSVIPFYLD